MGRTKKDDKRIVLGRPRKWETPEEMTKVIEEYFDNTPVNEWTVTGLALSIGASKQLLIDYQGREGYKEIVEEAKLMVENAYEMSLRIQGGAGNIFALKNFGWKDKQEIDQRTIEYNVGVTKDEAKKISKDLENEC